MHCYNGAPDGSDDSLSGQQYRNRETRILWDPTFQDPSWYGDIGINGRVINWIPTLKAMVSQYYPGLEIGCTEYNWGDEPNLNGATTQADVLGIYGREGFDLATRWTVAKNTSTSPTTYYPTYLASQIYRNYDGNQSTFGETSVTANVANPDNLSAFASVRASDGALTVMVINKQQGSTPVTVSLANFSSGATAQAWQINSASQTSIARLADVTVANNSVSATVPSQSITLFVIPVGQHALRPQRSHGTCGDRRQRHRDPDLERRGRRDQLCREARNRQRRSLQPGRHFGHFADQFHGFRSHQRDNLLLRRNRHQLGRHQPQLGRTSRDSACAAHIHFFCHSDAESGEPRRFNHHQRDRHGHREHAYQWRRTDHGSRPDRRHRAHSELHRAELHFRSIASLLRSAWFLRWRALTPLRLACSVRRFNCGIGMRRPRRSP